MLTVRVVYALGVLCGALTGFTFPFIGLASFGFVPLAVGLVWAAYDLTDAEGTGGKPPSAPQ